MDWLDPEQVRAVMEERGEKWVPYERAAAALEFAKALAQAEFTESVPGLPQWLQTPSASAVARAVRCARIIAGEDKE